MSLQTGQVCPVDIDRRVRRTFDCSPITSSCGVESSKSPGTVIAASVCKADILESSKVHPVLLVFLRQIGCTFAKQTLDDLSKDMPKLASRDVRVVIVHMSELDEGKRLLDQFALDHVEQFSDPSAGLYSEFGIPRGSLRQIIGPKVIVKGLWTALTKGFGIGYAGGDCFQMPGVVGADGGEIRKRFLYRDVSQRLSFAEFIGSDS